MSLYSKIEARKRVLAVDIATSLFVDGAVLVTARTGNYSGEISIMPGCVWIESNYPDHDTGRWSRRRALDAISNFAWGIACAEHGVTEDDL